MVAPWRLLTSVGTSDTRGVQSKQYLTIAQSAEFDSSMRCLARCCWSQQAAAVQVNTVRSERHPGRIAFPMKKGILVPYAPMRYVLQLGADLYALVTNLRNCQTAPVHRQIACMSSTTNKVRPEEPTWRGVSKSKSRLHLFVMHCEDLPVTHQTACMLTNIGVLNSLMQLTNVGVSSSLMLLTDVGIPNDLTQLSIQLDTAQHQTT
ncbi:hypothetical protein DUNSADRAFT_17898 [Dunaliella salina]|uniref:Encoded protein n=1 Tax=Dunaliella salina TaxID=3046 RepID=A0ABQ7H918_DUNSA|nr:hypothetical protein DUNSADRAFT_17898 [Dunaliella salina]|eukprot:KAF5843320.1 hypothetical protein DUNSADRAFT_17898 [Dunaliella salina]